MPRSWLSLFIRLGGWAAAALGVLLLVITAFSAGALYLADRFDRDGALAYAVVTGKRVGERTDASGEVRRRFLVEFTFKVRGAEGRPGQTVETDVSSPYFNRVFVGEEQPIRYLVSDPTEIEEDIGTYRVTGRVFRWIGLVLGIGGLLTLWLTGTRTNRAILARRDGDKRFATVTAIERSRLTVNGARQGRMFWREEDGRTGQTLLHRDHWLRERYRPGDSIVVYRRGRDAVWEGDVGPPAREAAKRWRTD